MPDDDLIRTVNHSMAQSINSGKFFESRLMYGWWDNSTLLIKDGKSSSSHRQLPRSHDEQDSAIFKAALVIQSMRQRHANGLTNPGQVGDRPVQHTHHADITIFESNLIQRLDRVRCCKRFIETSRNQDL